MKLITTSWDDGDPQDLRLAELLDKHNVQGTFYIPRKNEGKKVLSEEQIRILSKKFEIGGHTLHHKSMIMMSREEADHEVKGSFAWIKELTGTAPVSFCLPFGHYNDQGLDIIYSSGFKLIRTTGLLSPFYSSPLVHTTLQVYNHSKITYLKHLLKRGGFNSLNLWIKGGCPSNLFKLLDYYLDFVDMHGGCFHLWGHSWELEELGLWDKLDSILKHISNRSGFRYVNNREILTSF